MKRIAVLTAGGDTPAINATLHGVVTRANQCCIEVVGLLKGFSSLLNPKMPHVLLNPLFQMIPELDPTRGGTLIGASRVYIAPEQTDVISAAVGRLQKLGIEGLVCIGGDGTINGMQALAERMPVVLAPKTIDNDLGLNYPHELDHAGLPQPLPGSSAAHSERELDLEQMVNYATPGYATAVFVCVMGIMRLRTTAESHRRICIIEVMGRQSGYLALGAAYGQPDIVLLPEFPLNLDLVVQRIKELYETQKHVVIVCGEGIKDSAGRELGAGANCVDPAGNVKLSGAGEALRERLLAHFPDSYFRDRNRGDAAADVIFSRKVGHTQRGGRPVLFDRFHGSQLGGKAVDLLLERKNNFVATLQWSRRQGFQCAGIDTNKLRDRSGKIHPRQVHASFYDAANLTLSRLGVEYLLPIFNDAVGDDDVEAIRQTHFDSGNLLRPYHSINVDVAKRIRTLD